MCLKTITLFHARVNSACPGAFMGTSVGLNNYSKACVLDANLLVVCRFLRNGLLLRTMEKVWRDSATSSGAAWLSPSGTGGCNQGLRIPQEACLSRLSPRGRATRVPIPDASEHRLLGLKVRKHGHQQVFSVLSSCSSSRDLCPNLSFWPLCLSSSFPSIHPAHFPCP